MKAFEKFSELSVHETLVLSEALSFWITSDKILEPSIIRKLIPGIEEKNKADIISQIKAETLRLTALRTEDTSRLVFTLEKQINSFAEKEINSLVGEL